MSRFFEGDYRTRPEQNLAGASRQQHKGDLLNEIKLKREQREAERLIIRQVTLIQAFVRGYLTRKNIGNQLRNEFLNEFSTITKSNNFSLSNISYLLKRLPAFSKECRNNIMTFISFIRIIYGSQNVIVQEMSVCELWRWRIGSLIIFYIHLFTILDINSEENVFILEFIESFVDLNTYGILSNDHVQLIASNLIKRLDKPLLLIIWSLTSDSINVSIKKFLPSLLKKFLELINISKDTNLRLNTYKLLTEKLICPNGRAKYTILRILNNLSSFSKGEIIDVFAKNTEECFTTNAFYCLLQIDKNQNTIPLNKQDKYFEILSKFSICFIKLDKSHDMDEDFTSYHDLLIERCFKLINNKQRALCWLNILENILSKNADNELINFCKCVHKIWIPYRYYFYNNFILKKLIFHKKFINKLWDLIENLKRDVKYLKSVSLITIISRKGSLNKNESDNLIPILTLFCFCLKNYLIFTNPEEIFNDETFINCQKIINLYQILSEIAVGLVHLGYTNVYIPKDNIVHLNGPTNDILFNKFAWKYLLEEIILLLNLLIVKNEQKKFNFNTNQWVLTSINIDNFKNIEFFKNFEFIQPFETNGNLKLITSFQNQNYFILFNIPFIINFLSRLDLFNNLILESKSNIQNITGHINRIPYLTIIIRRDAIYEDAFHQLSMDQIPEMRYIIRVHMGNETGAIEPGIDGGGIFREFISQLLQISFEPNRGFFIFNKNQQLYPNPLIYLIEPEYIQHYFFIGRMLAKAIYEGVLIDLPLADFFIYKISTRKNNLNVNFLYSLDNELYKNLIKLLLYKNEELTNLDLDFSLHDNEYGQSKITELKENGNKVSVSEDNVLEYIHEVGNYKIDKQIKRQCDAFFEGFSTVIPLDWLRLFSTKEIQMIISGNDSPIDVDDMRRHTVYSGGFHENHPTIILFWEIVYTLNDEEKSQLLKFVTSYSRAPFLGFKELQPPFCIQYMDGDDEHLPSASTCVNILRLPNFSNGKIMRQKLLYAINSLSGFELI